MVDKILLKLNLNFIIYNVTFKSQRWHSISKYKFLPNLISIPSPEKCYNIDAKLYYSYYMTLYYALC